MILLPKEIILIIFEKLDFISQINTSSTCKFLFSYYFTYKPQHIISISSWSKEEWNIFINWFLKYTEYLIFKSNLNKEKYLFIEIKNSNIMLKDDFSNKYFIYNNFYDLIDFVNSTKYEYIVFFTCRINTYNALNFTVLNKKL